MPNNPDNTSDLTQDLPAVEMLRLVLADVRDIKTRVGDLEAGAVDRARETRPKLDTIISELADLREESKLIRRELGLLREDIRNERLARVELAERIDDLERRPN